MVLVTTPHHLPQKQDRVLNSDEQLAAQKKEQSGGKVVYTGMNDAGEFFTGYNKLSAITGEEEVIAQSLPIRVMMLSLSSVKKVSVSLMNFWLEKVSRLRVEITTIELHSSMVQ